MPEKKMYQIRFRDGTLRTVTAYSPRAAVKFFVAKYDPPSGDIDVKERGAPSSEWQRYRVK